MEDIAVLIHHNGLWESNNRFVNKSVDGILLSSECTFLGLVKAIAAQLRRDADAKLMEIKYKVNEGVLPLTISNDMSVKLYIQLKKRNPDITLYPLCITFQETNVLQTSTTANLVATLADGVGYLGISETVQGSNTMLLSKGNAESTDATPLDAACILNNPEQEQIEVGQLYRNKEILQDAMRHYAIKNKFQFKVHRSCSKRYCLICMDENCSWTFISSSVHNTKMFKVRKFVDVHTCSVIERLYDQRHATSGFVGSMIVKNYVDPKTVYAPKDIIRDIKHAYGVDMNYTKAWRSRQKALEKVRGNPSQSYGKLPSYLYMLRRTNPGTVTKLVKTYDDSFLYVFVALATSIKGWEYCKPIVVVDGSFLKAAHRGTLITACTQDAAGRIFPLAYSVVDSENDASWEWFFKMFKETYGYREGMCIVSDRHESILKATSIVYPEVSHCVCMFHLWNNIKVRFRKSQRFSKDVFFAAARAYTVCDFDYQMNELASIDNRVNEYLMKIGYERWSRAHSVVKRSMTMTSNIAESINAANKDARDLPITPLLDYMASLVCDWSYENMKNAMGKFTKLGKKYEDILEENIRDSQRMTVKSSSELLHAVFDEGSKFMVDFEDKTCSCKRFQMDEIPCPHASAVLTKKKLDAYEYCSDYYTKKNLLKTYELPVVPVMNETSWDVPAEILEEVVLPPTGRIPAGRPKRLRIKSQWESVLKRVKIYCGLCGHHGHNRKTCRNIPKVN